ncbi:MAG: cbb3-type cytochrome oxidase subunit 3 [Magnetospiraceae bacterium]
MDFIMELYELVRPFWVVWLMIVCGGILFWVFNPKNKARFEQDAQIPLADDE